MRCTQDRGLPQLAYDFLNENQKTTEVKICPTCNHHSGGEGICEKYNSAADRGMFGDGPELYKYQLKDDSWVYEKVQAVPWSSGPCIFLMLVDQNNKPLFKWSDDEINNC